MNKWLVMAILTAMWLFGAGLLIGRELPAHHFERFGNSGYLFDASSGKLCRAFGATEAAKNADGFEIVSPNPIDKALNTTTPDPWDKYAVKTPPNATDKIPACVP